jgi:hypothetical protein
MLNRRFCDVCCNFRRSCLADAGEGDTTDGTTDEDASAISTDISEADTDSNIPSAEALQSTSSLATTEIAPNSEETPEDKPIFGSAPNKALYGG